MDYGRAGTGIPFGGSLPSSGRGGRLPTMFLLSDFVPQLLMENVPRLFWGWVGIRRKQGPKGLAVCVPCARRSECGAEPGGVKAKPRASVVSSLDSTGFSASPGVLGARERLSVFVGLLRCAAIEPSSLPCDRLGISGLCRLAGTFHACRVSGLSDGPVS